MLEVAPTCSYEKTLNCRVIPAATVTSVIGSNLQFLLKLKGIFTGQEFNSESHTQVNDSLLGEDRTPSSKSWLICSHRLATRAQQRQSSMHENQPAIWNLQHFYFITS